MEEEASLGVNEATQLTEPEAAENVSKGDSGVVDTSTLSRDDSSSESAEMRTEQEVTRLAAAAEGAEGSADSLAGLAAGSDSGVEGCGRAPSSAGGERSCASSVVSCGSGCGSESSSLAAAPRARRRVSVPATDPKRGSPVGASTPRPATAPRGPNLATRDRARSREKPTPPEKPRPLTPKPRIRPTADLPNLVRESPALRAKPTKTSAARCRTPSSPGEERRWGSAAARLPAATAAAADKYGTLPRRRRDAASSGRAAPRPRVRIYAEKTAQTALTGTDLDAALAGLMPVMDCRLEVTRCNKGVQASSRDSELSRLTAAAAAAEALANEEKERRVRVESQLAAERAARLAAIAELERNSQKLLELAGAGAGANADGCLRALEEQLRSAGEVAAKQRSEIDALRQHCDKLHMEGSQAREAARVAVARLEEAEREAAEMQEFLAAETGALGASLRDADSELQRLHHDLATRRAECRHLVRLCEQRRQEAMTSVARARSSNQATVAIDLISKKIAELTEAVTRGTGIREPNGISPDEENRTTLLTAIAHAFKNSVQAPVPQNLPQTPQNMPQTPQNLPQTPQMGQDEDKSHISEDNDNSADLLDSETEPCLVTDPECAEEWWSGAEGAGGWSNDELSPERENCDDREGECPSERESLRSLSAAIALRQRSEDERGGLSQRVAALSDRVDQLARALRTVYTRDNAETPDKNVVTSAIVKKLAELDLGRQMVEHYKHNVDVCKQQGESTNEDEDLEFLEEELLSCDESSRRDLYEALDAALAAFTTRQHIVKSWSRLAAVHRTMERLAFAVAAPPKPNHTVTVQTTA